MTATSLPTSVDPLVARIAFSKIKGLNHSTAQRLLGLVGSPENFFTLTTNALSATCRLDSRICDSSYR
ncbi:MAG: hypothetical protein K2K94_03740, partial [Muribaculaceae bacterium]|nr:hypothetical protein [Muribaculaceae bacterium]